jgi:hypothetical protein
MRLLPEKILLPQIKADRGKERWTRSSAMKKALFICLGISLMGYN